jgi:hypothetical protein
MGSKMPRKMASVVTVWSLLRGLVIWYCWLDRNAICFSEEDWQPAKMKHLIWDAFIDHARTAWYRTKWMIEKTHGKRASLLASFDKVWLQSQYIGRRQDLEIFWNFNP